MEMSIYEYIDNKNERANKSQSIIIPNFNNKMNITDKVIEITHTHTNKHSDRQTERRKHK